MYCVYGTVPVCTCVQDLVLQCTMLNISELFYSAPGTQCTRYERVCRNAGNLGEDSIRCVRFLAKAQVLYCTGCGRLWQVLKNVGCR
jgi:hypothetical protein